MTNNYKEICGFLWDVNYKVIMHQNLISLQIHTDIGALNMNVCPVYTTTRGLSQAEIAEFAKRLARLKKKALATT